jgi:type III pantothenate kinase
MLLCLDVGNSQIHGGVFVGSELRVQFRRSTHPIGSSDELGLFLRSVLRENAIDPREVRRVAICSVVPTVMYPLHAAAVKYFGLSPFVLRPGVKTGLRIRYRNPQEVGADRIAAAVAAVHRWPDRDLLVVDCGTATTFEVITAGRDYLGGAILPGLGISVEVLAGKTAKLPAVEITRPGSALGRSTTESIQSGLFHGHLGAIRHLLRELALEAFGPGIAPVVVATGGFSRLFAEERVFDHIAPDLVLQGLCVAEQLNRDDAPAAPPALASEPAASPRAPVS